MGGEEATEIQKWLGDFLVASASSNIARRVLQDRG